MGGLVAWVGVFAIVGGHAIESTLGGTVVELGHCSGTLVAADAVLTSAHCLDGPIDHVIVDGRDVRVLHCAAHPAYEPGQPAHDIGYCRLADSVPGAATIDDGPQLTVGSPVSLEGWGMSSPWSHESGALRVVTASVVGVEQGWLDVGSATATACRGDSGGPMLVDRGGDVRVAGVIHGAKAAICASPTQVVPIRPHRDWLLHELEGPGGTAGSRRFILVLSTLLAVAVLIGSAAWRRTRARRPPDA